MASKTDKKKNTKEQFDEYGFRIIGDDDEVEDVVVSDQKKAASDGCKASNLANRSLVPALEKPESKKKK